MQQTTSQVEFFVANHYIDEVIAGRESLDILDVGAGTGRYSVRLAELGHNVTAVELVNKNVSQIKMKSNKIIAKQGADKVLFGSDCPWSDAKKTYDFINSFNLTEDEKQKIFMHGC